MTGSEAIKILTTKPGTYTDEDRMEAICVLMGNSNAFDLCLEIAKKNGTIDYDTMKCMQKVHAMTSNILSKQIKAELKKEKPKVGRKRNKGDDLNILFM